MPLVASAATRSLRIRLAAFLAVALACVAPVRAAGGGACDLRFEDGTRSIQLLVGLSHHADPTGGQTIREILADDVDWAPCLHDTPVYGFTDAAQWFRFRVVNDTVNPDFMFSFDYSIADEVDVHQVQDGRLIDSVRLGDTVPFGERLVPHHSFVVPARIPPGAARDFYVRVRSSSSLQAPMTLWTRAAFISAANNDYLAHGLFFGMMLAMAAYGLFVYVSIRDLNYLLFAAYSLLFTGIPATMRGFGFQYLWPESVWLQQNSFLIFVPAVAAISFAFAARVMNLRLHAPRLERAFMLATFASAAVIIPALLADYHLAIRCVLGLALVEEVFISAVGIWTWRRYGTRPALLFSMGWVAFFAGSCMMILNRFGLVPRSLATELGPSTGILAMATVMALALAESLRETRRERREAQKALEQHLEDSRRQLEHEVQRRTADLQTLLRQLAETNEEIETKNKQDGLTGVFNRASFDERLEREFMKAWDEDSPVSVIMVDIDHFKNFNDTFGHQVGDECLIQVARAIEKAARSSQDFAARYGGEEFTVIVSRATDGKALEVGERIRAAVEGMEFLVDGARVPVTVSVGVATTVPELDELPATLVAAADAALYAAKEGGRNRVECSLEPAAN